MTFRSGDKTPATVPAPPVISVFSSSLAQVGLELGGQDLRIQVVQLFFASQSYKAVAQ